MANRWGFNPTKRILMKKTQKKTCNGCKAYQYPYDCALDYPIKEETHSPGLVVGGIPLEPCPKPKTIAEYLHAKQNIHIWGRD